VEGFPYEARFQVELERTFHSVTRRSEMEHLELEVRDPSRDLERTAGLISLSCFDTNVMNTHYYDVKDSS
jgi:hypothetical protein